MWVTATDGAEKLDEYDFFFLFQYWPYLLMLRGKLAEEGMLNEDICLGTKATTQRSDTWETKVKPVFYFYELVARSC